MGKRIFVLLVGVMVLFAGFHSVNTVQAASKKTKYVTASTLNIRSGPGTSYKVVITVKKNQAVTVTQTKGSWDKVTVGKKTGWASNKYLTTKKPAAKATTSTKTMYVTASTLNVRSGTGTNYKVVATVKKINL